MPRLFKSKKKLGYGKLRINSTQFEIETKNSSSIFAGSMFCANYTLIQWIFEQ